MAIVQNTVSEIGDVLQINVETPILGIVLLSSFIDNVIGESENKYFEKIFRYSLDGITFSEWVFLTNENIEKIEINPTNIFIVQYKYIRSGSDTTGLLEFNEVTLNGTFEPLYNPDLYSHSIFAQFFDFWDVEVLTWALNVLEKIYRGIVPKYIERGQNDNSNWTDKDFIDFWMSITHYFAIFVRYVRLFENIQSNKILLLQYLRSHDLYVCDDIDDVDLIYLMNNLFDEIRQRGTIQIALPKEIIDESDSDSSSSLETQAKQVNGELLRLICKKTTDEFIFCPVESWKVGWFIDQSSPMYKGINAAFNAIKSYEKSQGIIDISKYPIINSQYFDLINEIDKNGVLKISNVDSGQVSGIGIDDIDFYNISVSLLDEFFNDWTSDFPDNWTPVVDAGGVACVSEDNSRLLLTRIIGYIAAIDYLNLFSDDVGSITLKITITIDTLTSGTNVQLIFYQDSTHTYTFATINSVGTYQITNTVSRHYNNFRLGIVKFPVPTGISAIISHIKIEEV